MVREYGKMVVKKGYEKDYYIWHQKVYAELEDLFAKAGVSEYSIFLDEYSNSLFYYLEYENKEEWEKIPGTKICREWWDLMSTFLEMDENNNPKIYPLKKMYHFQIEEENEIS